ncbi:YSIRK-type signal peptide-containing protein [uncultured Streptococcus sp.]|nr:YSIRK-type signal peptide-containing protein [uncultured Streptococcus sp.]
MSYSRMVARHQERYSLRKKAGIGVASVMIGSLTLLGGKF